MHPQDNSQDWHQQKTYESMITYVLNAIRFVMLANGGAIIAILTFIGNRQDLAGKLVWPILCFVIGVILGGIVNITAYLTQLTLFNQKADNVPIVDNHTTWLWSSIIFIGLGILFFAIGALCSVFALK